MIHKQAVQTQSDHFLKSMPIIRIDDKGLQRTCKKRLYYENPAHYCGMAYPMGCLSACILQKVGLPTRLLMGIVVHLRTAVSLQPSRRAKIPILSTLAKPLGYVTFSRVSVG